MQSTAAGRPDLAHCMASHAYVTRNKQYDTHTDLMQEKVVDMNLYHPMEKSDRVYSRARVHMRDTRVEVIHTIPRHRAAHNRRAAMLRRQRRRVTAIATRAGLRICRQLACVTKHARRCQAEYHHIVTYA
jgi:hypothetical protein